MEKHQYLWGIDLGGTKIEGVVLDRQDPDRILARKRVPTEANLGYQHIIQQIVKLIDLLSDEVGTRPKTLGIGTPGTLDPQTQTMKNSNTTCLIGQPFKADLVEALGIPIRIANDANCFALAETKMGAVATQFPDAKVVFGIIMGTGVGGGIVINGQVLDGKQGIAGEWGHNFLDESGGKCYCGKTGCVETIISGPSLERFYYEQSGKKRRLSEILQAYHEDQEEYAVATVQRLLHFFGKAVSQIINLLDPDAIVLGGGLSNIDLLYSEGIQAIEEHVFNVRMETPVLAPKLGDSAGVFGAAQLVADD